MNIKKLSFRTRESFFLHTHTILSSNTKIIALILVPRHCIVMSLTIPIHIIRNFIFPRVSIIFYVPTV